MSNKLISLLLTIFMLLCLSACETTETSSSPANTPSESQTLPLTNQSKPTSTTNQPTHSHSYSNATCTSPKKCFCGATEGIALGHNYSKATCTSPKKCTRCFDEVGIALGHSYSSATCTSPKICVRCGTAHGAALGHKYLNATCTRPKICERCDSILEDALGHDFKNESCLRCGKLDRTYLFEDIESFSKDRDIRYTFDAVKDNTGNTYYGHCSIYSVQLVNSSSVEFETGKRFSKFSGIAFLPYGSSASYDPAKIYIYGDGKLLYQSPDLAKGCKPDNFVVDIMGVSFLTIKFENKNSINSSTIGYLTNAYFSK